MPVAARVRGLVPQARQKRTSGPRSSPSQDHARDHGADEQTALRQRAVVDRPRVGAHDGRVVVCKWRGCTFWHSFRRA
jgi:hypothetical protein